MRGLTFRVMILLTEIGVVRAEGERWPIERAKAWADGLRWLVGANYIPSNAINPLEMWQGETFDPELIDREMALAESLGFNSVRVFLHDLLWEQDSAGFLARIETFLEIAERHKIGVMFVLFDSVWDPLPQLGAQPAPKPHVHNSGWVQSPGLGVLKDPARQGALKGYVQGVIGRFKDDRRIQAWDLWNEPDNPNRSSDGKLEPANKAELVLPVLKQVFTWAREVGPAQPLTSGVWVGAWGNAQALSPMSKYQLEQSDVISFHTYEPVEQAGARIASLRHHSRPLLCTEFMARPQGSTFDPVLGLFKDEHVAAYCWGFVAGKTQTIYPWDSWTKSYSAEPPVWFHDIFRASGAPYDPREVVYIRRMTGKEQ